MTGVKRLTRFPSGSRNSRERFPHGIVVGSVTNSATTGRSRWWFPAGLAGPVDGPSDEPDDDWVRVRLWAEQLDWVPAVLVGLGLPFVVEQPAALRDLLRALAVRLTAAADGGEPVQEPTA